jgi:hypothetical protein
MRSGKTTALADWPPHPMRHSINFSCGAILVFSTLWLAGCGREPVAVYRVAKEKAPSRMFERAAAALPASEATASRAAVAAEQAAMSSSPVVTAEGAELSWTAPAHWQTKPTGAMRKGSYTVTGQHGEVADFAITAFPGDVGGEVANINRWRGQLQLPPFSDAEAAASLTRISSHGLGITVVEVANSNTSPAQRLLGAIVPFGEATWFFKLIGPETVVTSERAVFFELINTVKRAGVSPVAPVLP